MALRVGDGGKPEAAFSFHWAAVVNNGLNAGVVLPPAAETRLCGARGNGARALPRRERRPVVLAFDGVAATDCRVS